MSQIERALSSWSASDVKKLLSFHPNFQKRRDAFLVEMEKFDCSIQHGTEVIEDLEKRIVELKYRIKHYDDIPQAPGGMECWYHFDRKTQQKIKDYLVEVIQAEKELMIDQKNIYKNQILRYKQRIAGIKSQIGAFQKVRDGVIAGWNEYLDVLSSGKAIRVVTRKDSSWNDECQKVFGNISKNWSKLCMKIKDGRRSGPSKDWFTDNKKEFQKSQDTLIYVLEQGNVVGFVIGHEITVLKKDKAFYIELFCGPGNGRKLWENIHNHAERKGYPLLALRAASQDKRARAELIRYYESHGFARTANKCASKHMSPKSKGLDENTAADGVWMTKCLK